MRRKALLVTVLALFIFTVAALSVGQVSAAGTIDVTAVNGDSSFTTTVLGVEKLEGIQTVDGMIYPAGFVAKEAQFIGDAVRVQGHSYGQASVCFSFTESTEGWKGDIYQWGGNKWNKLVTTLNSGGEGVPTACASFYGDGDLALIGGFSGTIKKAAVLPDCVNKETGEVIEGYYWAYLSYMVPIPIDVGDGYVLMGIQFSTFSGSSTAPILEPNIPVRAWVTGFGPEGTISVVQASGTGSSGTFAITDPLITYKQFSYDPYFISFTVVVDGKCQENFTYSPGMDS